MRGLAVTRTWMRSQGRLDEASPHEEKYTSPKTSETIAELDRNIMDWEYTVRRYEEACDKPMDEDHKSLHHHRDAKEHLDLNVKEDTGCEDVWILTTVRNVDLHRDRGGVLPRDVANLHTKNSEYDDYNTQEYMSENKDAVAWSTMCHTKRRKEWRLGHEGQGQGQGQGMLRASTTIRHGVVLRAVLVPQQNRDQARQTSPVAFWAKHTA